MFWGRLLSICTQHGGRGGYGVLVIRNAYSCVQGDEGCHASWVLTHLYSLFSCFWQYNCLKGTCIFCKNLTLPSFK